MTAQYHQNYEKEEGGDEAGGGGGVSQEAEKKEKFSASNNNVFNLQQPKSQQEKRNQAKENDELKHIQNIKLNREEHEEKLTFSPIRLVENNIFSNNKKQLKHTTSTTSTSSAILSSKGKIIMDEGLYNQLKIKLDSQKRRHEHINNHNINNSSNMDEKTFNSRVATAKNGNTSSNDSQLSKSVRLFLLNQIKLAIIIVRYIHVVWLQLGYFLYLNFDRVRGSCSRGDKSGEQQKQAASNVNTNQNDTSNNTQPPLAPKAKSGHPPSHVCVILNENLRDNDSIFKLYDTIASIMAANRVKMLTFYSFNDASRTVKERILEKYKTTDLNNNIGSSFVSANAIKKNDFQYDEAVINHQKVKLTNPNELRQMNLDEIQPLNEPESASSANKTTRFDLIINFVSFSNNGGPCILAKICKNIAQKIYDGHLSLTDVNQETIDRHIIESTDFFEPQLIISIGQNDCLAGFSPWHLRLSEIIKVQSHKLINTYTLKEILNKFIKIEKRFGK